jgi:hypothetical protein
MAGFDPGEIGTEIALMWISDRFRNFEKVVAIRSRRRYEKATTLGYNFCSKVCGGVADS